MNEGHFDPFICETLAQRGCIEGAVFWDVGAHIGYHSLCFAALASPGGRVVHDGYPRRGTHLRVALLHHRPARLTAQPPSGDVPIREDNYQD